jgi:7-cyano-7-deazaguanine synthase
VSSVDDKGTCRSVVVLLSGGVDSAACAHFYLQSDHRVVGLFVDYGQATRVREYKAACIIAQELGIKLSRVSVSGLPPLHGKIRGRNAALIVLALMWFPDPCGLIGIGVHSGTSYEDCSPFFIRQMQAIADLYSDGCIRISAPFSDWRKRAIWEYARTHCVPIQHTYSCEVGVVEPCGTCQSCMDIEALNAG